ncbi:MULTISPECIES: SUMF1/EgtB/PvdO family nonheme iron enzyme [unclassified Treponema]|uniref:formylglycine-generating enzyme family protein n=1 Tax=unclassified Treponema TaxID=2638727 RepID=UPI0020A35647|nr:MULTISPECIES: SUMF1/EgtB/PvdO family nonheme iron enzyme [unclassified Treponema]UTC67316.1 SUMF1/EgtB/PvdO family nonheme iron enzyme [Treponema sp. OMZ 789]UTC70044.1 SUMF1/EgtB/PvdO family nonheme iron enzyme [Treponema sp. OMZ 790]UTC72760.1 SUMF1/EgtB/PvdO family nonheme iron enzyme [Treponema sp. OMZ 791]
MKTINKHKAHAFKGAVALITTAFLALLLTASPNTAGGGGGGTLAPFADKTYTVEGVSFTMKAIKAAKPATLGVADESNNPEHTVNLRAYFIGETEVTQELWEKVMGENPSYFQGADKLPAAGEEQGKRSVEKVSWVDCIAFCNELTKKVTELGAAECVYYLKEDGTTVYTKEHVQAGKEPVQEA